jgi:hypothetical protein
MPADPIPDPDDMHYPSSESLRACRLTPARWQRALAIREKPHMSEVLICALTNEVELLRGELTAIVTICTETRYDEFPGLGVARAVVDALDDIYIKTEGERDVALAKLVEGAVLTKEDEARLRETVAEAVQEGLSPLKEVCDAVASVFARAAEVRKKLSEKDTVE